MNTWEKNYKLLQISATDYLLDKINMPLDKNYILEKNQKTNFSTLKINKDDKSMYLNSKYNPIDEVHRFINSIALQPYDVLVIVGGGLGYIAKELKTIISSTNKVIILEPNIEIFKACLTCNDMSDIFSDSRFIYTVDDSLSDLGLNLKNNIENKDIYNTKIYLTKSYMNIFPEICLQLKEIIMNYINQKKLNNNTALKFASQWHSNCMLNINEMFSSHSVNLFKDIFKNKPCVIVSAGPSLNKNVELLKEIKGKIPILAVYTALKVLDNHNIEPDIVFALDGKQMLYDEYKNIKFNMAFFYKPNLNPEVLNSHKGNKIFSNSLYNFSYFEIFGFLNKKLDIIQQGGSVVCDTTDFANYMGCNVLIFIGQDLAFTDNKTHADGTYYDGDNDISNEKMKENDLIFKTLDIYGNEIYTDEMLYTFLKWLEDYERITNADKHIVTFINATEGGASIGGFINYSLRNAIDTYCKEDSIVNVDKVLSDVFKKPFFLTKDELPKVISFFEDMYDNLENLCPFLIEGIALSNRLKKLYSSKKIPSQYNINIVLKAFDKVDKEISKTKTEFSFMGLLFQNAIDELFKLIKKRDTNNAGMQAAEESLIIYTSMHKVVIEHQPVLKKVIYNLKNLKL